MPRDKMAPTLDREMIRSFLVESLGIEGITRPPTSAEEAATEKFLDEDHCTLLNVLLLQKVYAPGMPLRNVKGMDVRVGRYTPPPGSPQMAKRLTAILEFVPDPFDAHVQFELLHPFMDGNGRVGRTVWAWKMLASGKHPFELPFLHRFYYQTLAYMG